MTQQRVQLSPSDMARLSELAYNLAHNNKTRAQFANLVAQVDPSSAKAFSDVAVDMKLNAFMRKIEDDRMKEKMGQVQQAKESQKNQVIKARKLNADQVKELEKIQTQYGFSDWGAAADIYATRHPAENPALVPPPETYGESTWEFPTVPGPDGKMLAFKDYVQNPRKFSNNTAIQMITEFKRGRLSPAFHGA